MATEVFFFAETDLMEAQMGAPGDSAFGPVTGSEFTKFRVTSLHEGVLNGNSRSDPHLLLTEAH